MRIARLIAAGVEAAQPRPRRGRGKQRHLAVLVRQRARREPARQPADDIVAEDERRQHLAAGAARLLADRQYRRQHLHRRLARDEAQPFAQFDRAAGDAVKSAAVRGSCAGQPRA